MNPQGREAASVPARAAETLQLPDDLQLPASTLPPKAAPAWQGSALRRRLLLRAVLGVAGFAALVVGLVFILGFVTRPYWADFVRVPAIVTSQRPYFSRGDHCDLSLEFTLDGRDHTATFDPASTCAGMPKPGTTVTASVDPADPSYALIVGLDQSQRNVPYVLAFMGSIWLGISGVIIGLGVSTYRQARILTATAQWKRLSATVLRRYVYKNTTELTLQAPGRDGTPQIFQLTYSGRGPWPNRPQAGHVTELWILADGGRQVLFSGPDCQDPAAGRAHVPNSFELRTMGI